MTRLRKMMLEELERRKYSEGTIRCYLRAVADFARYFHRSPDQLRPEHVRQYQAYLFRERKLQATSVTQRLAALRFFFLKTLKQRWGMEETPYPKKVRRLPTILSQEEVARLVDSAPTPFYRILVMTPLCHRRTLCRGGATPSRRYRQPAHGRAYPRRQGP